MWESLSVPAAIFVVLAALVHVYIFVLESVVFRRSGHRVFGLREQDVPAARDWAYNQGFYNLFLAIGALLGVALSYSASAGPAGPAWAWPCWRPGRCWPRPSCSSRTGRRWFAPRRSRTSTGVSSAHDQTADGPVDAVVKAIDHATGIHVQVRTFEVHSVTVGEDAQGEALLTVEHNGRTYRGAGISTNILEAAARAYLEVINRIEAANASADRSGEGRRSQPGPTIGPVV